MVIYYLSAWAVAVAISLGIYYASKPKEGAGVAQADPVPESLPEPGRDRVREIVGRAYWELSKKGVPWLWRLSSVARCGGSVPVAVFALEETIKDLSGRYYVKPLQLAIDELKTL